MYFVPLCFGDNNQAAIVFVPSKLMILICLSLGMTALQCMIHDYCLNLLRGTCAHILSFTYTIFRNIYQDITENSTYKHVLHLNIQLGLKAYLCLSTSYIAEGLMLCFYVVSMLEVVNLVSFFMSPQCLKL